MTDFQRAIRYAGAGHKMRFYQDFYGRQWVKVQGGLMFWRSRRIQLANEEVLQLKRYINNAFASRKQSSHAAQVFEAPGKPTATDGDRR